MFANSLSVILLGLFIGLPTLGFLAWGVFAGQFDNLASTSHMIFEESDLTGFRPWETVAQADEREFLYGNISATDSGWMKWL